MAATFELLGPLRAYCAGQEIVITAARERSALAALLLQPDRLVSVDRLVEAMWTEQAPRTARNQVQAAISQLRRHLLQAGCEAAIVSEPAGYRIRIEPSQVDLHEFRGLTAAARTAAGQGPAG